MNWELVLEQIRKSVIDESSINSRIMTRFYPAQLATVENPEFPCANFAFIGGNPDNDIPKISFRSFNVWVWSNKSREEAYLIYQLIKDKLNKQLFNSTEVNFVIRETSSPMDDIDHTANLNYLMATWRCDAVEA